MAALLNCPEVQLDYLSMEVMARGGSPHRHYLMQMSPFVLLPDLGDDFQDDTNIRGDQTQKLSPPLLREET